MQEQRKHDSGEESPCLPNQGVTHDIWRFCAGGWTGIGVAASRLAPLRLSKGSRTSDQGLLTLPENAMIPFDDFEDLSAGPDLRPLHGIEVGIEN